MILLDDIQWLTREEFNKILDSPGETYEPRGLFLCRDWLSCGKFVWSAMRNMDGAGETEEFFERRSAIRWLHGHPVGEAQFYREPGSGKEKKEIERLLDILGRE